MCHVALYKMLLSGSEHTHALQIILGSLAVALGLFGYFFYVKGILKGTVKPHAFTWFV